MKLLAWLSGVWVILVGLELALYAHDAWRAVWIAAGLLWLLLGAGVAISTLVRAAMRRGLGSLRVPPMPGPKQSEK